MSKIYKPLPVSGFPEWLPEVRALELQWLDHIRRVFESYGFCNIETPAVEVLDVLLAKGETDKEIYALHRLQADEKDKSDARLGLHFDLTVPFARYTAQHFNELSFPFKRYQIQKVWRGERPQEGRFREFYQCDIDIINPDNLPWHFEAEIPAIIDEILQGLNLPPYTIFVNDRRVLLGYLQGLGLEDKATNILRILDKNDKIGRNGVIKELIALGLSEDIARNAADILDYKGHDINALARALNLSDNTMLKEGIENLSKIFQALQVMIGENRVQFDLSIVRGFDYYTGTVYETKFNDYPDIGSIVSGGRYDNLASSFINKKLPGVGISIGLSRLLSVMLQKGIVSAINASPTDVLITYENEERYKGALELAKKFRSRKLNVEVYHNATKLQKQLAYADKKQIPYVWFLAHAEQPQHQVKNMLTGTQDTVDPETWQPA